MEKLHLIVFLLLGLTYRGQADFTVNNRLDCVLVEDNDLTEAECKSRSCIWDPNPAPADLPLLPRCYLDPKQVGYTGPVATEPTGLEADLNLKPTAAKSTPNLEQIQNLKLQVSYLSDQILRIKITDTKRKRFEVPLERFSFTIPEPKQPSNPAYTVSLEDNDQNFNLKVTRKSTGSTLLDTSIGGLIYSDQFLQIASYLPSTDVYGFGENYHPTLRRKLNYMTIPIFGHDQDGVHGEIENLYGHHPFFTVIEKDGKAFGVFLFNTSPISYTMLPAPAVSLKAAGGVLDLFVFVGENPEQVVQLYTSIIGRSGLPSFWALGNQQSRWGYSNTSLLRKVITRNIEAGVPLDVMYIDSDYKEENREFTVKPEMADLNQLIAEFREKYQIRWTPIIDPVVATTGPASYIPWSEGHKNDVFVNWPPEQWNNSAIHSEPVPDPKIFYGKMWPKGPVAFIDFFKTSGRKFFKDMLRLLYKDFNYDGLWIDMNEPAVPDGTWSDICPNDTYKLVRPRQGFKTPISVMTICMGAVQGDHGEFKHYDVHSLYGLSEMKSTQEIIHETTGKRGFMLSRNTFPSAGQFTAHWLGDTNANWDVMRWTLIGMMDMNLFGISFVGVDICGFFGVPGPELCQRWMQAGAYFPFSRNHQNGGQPDHDPAIYGLEGHPEVTKAAVSAYRTRYQLLHYLYTKFYRSAVYGDTVMRPLVHEFPTDDKVRGLYEQFLLGSAVMVNPFLYPNQTSVTSYIPEGSTWYRFAKTGGFVEPAKPTAESVTFDDSESSRPLLFQGASIIPVIPDSGLPKLVNTATIRRVPIELWVLPCSKGEGYGDLFFDDGDSIDTLGKGLFNYYEFKLAKCKLEIDVKNVGYKAADKSQDILQVSSINVALWKSLASAPKVTLDGTEIPVTLTKTSLQLNLKEHLDLLKLKKDQKIVVQFGTGSDCFAH